MGSSVLIVGASRGLGLEFVRQYRAAGAQVVATARTDEGLAAISALGATAIKLDVALDVNNTASASGLAWQIDGHQFDEVVFVAGVYGPHTSGLETPTEADFNAVMHANVLGPMRVLPQLQDSGQFSAERRFAADDWQGHLHQFSSGLGEDRHGRRGGRHRRRHQRGWDAGGAGQRQARAQRQLLQLRRSSAGLVASLCCFGVSTRSCGEIKNDDEKDCCQLAEGPGLDGAGCGVARVGLVGQQQPLGRCAKRCRASSASTAGGHFAGRAQRVFCTDRAGCA